MLRRITERLAARLRLSPRPTAPPGELAAYREAIGRHNASQPNRELLDAIRVFNHRCVDSLAEAVPLTRMRLLDIGASPHGYALERALERGVSQYIGIGLDVADMVDVRTAASTGLLLRMDAQNIQFPDGYFDLALSISTCEHVASVPAVLGEIKRVLKPGGKALITFEPVWTCSYGHHLHEFGEVSALMPGWAHLLWDKREMLRNLGPVWPAGAPLSLDEAAHRVYEGGVINRIGIGAMRDHFARCGMTVEWMVPLEDQARDAGRLAFVAQATGIAAADLMVKGLSVLLRK